MTALRPLITGAAIALTAMCASPSALAGGDAAKGETVARDVCTMCHKLPDGTGQTVAPPLATFAAQAPSSAETIAEVLAQPQHAPAKGQVQADQHDDIAAYLNSLP
jgi:cytochrome c2